MMLRVLSVLLSGLVIFVLDCTARLSMCDSRLGIANLSYAIFIFSSGSGSMAHFSTRGEGAVSIFDPQFFLYGF